MERERLQEGERGRVRKKVKKRRHSVCSILHHSTASIAFMQITTLSSSLWKWGEAEERDGGKTREGGRGGREISERKQKARGKGEERVKKESHTLSF